MSKIFLYMYPIKENVRSCFASSGFYNEISPYKVLNECIQKRYKDKGYSVLCVVYKDKEDVYGIKKEIIDQTISLDIDYNEEYSYDKSNYKEKCNNARNIIQKLGEDIEEVVVGGYYAMDMVSITTQAAVDAGINAIVDLDLTDYFASLYKQKGFKIEEYDPYNFKELWLERAKEKYRNDWGRWKERIEEDFDQHFLNPIFGFNIMRDTNSSPDNSSVER